MLSKKRFGEKSTKAEVNYRKGREAVRCGVCKMFRPPDKCVAVLGDIKPDDVCDLFVHK